MTVPNTQQGRSDPSGALWVLSHPVAAAGSAAAGIAGAAGSVAEAAGSAASGVAAQIDANVFRDALHAFATTLDNALVGIPINAGNFELDEVIFQADFSADVGFILIGGVAAQGAITFKYVRNPNTLPTGYRG